MGTDFLVAGQGGEDYNMSVRRTVENGRRDGFLSRGLAASMNFKNYRTRIYTD